MGINIWLHNIYFLMLKTCTPAIKIELDYMRWYEKICPSVRAVSLYKHSGAPKYILCLEVSEHSADNCTCGSRTANRGRQWKLFIVSVWDFASKSCCDRPSMHLIIWGILLLQVKKPTNKCISHYLARRTSFFSVSIVHQQQYTTHDHHYVTAYAPFVKAPWNL